MLPWMRLLFEHARLQMGTLQGMPFVIFNLPMWLLIRLRSRRGAYNLSSCKWARRHRFSRSHCWYIQLKREFLSPSRLRIYILLSTSWLKSGQKAAYLIKLSIAVPSEEGGEPRNMAFWWALAFGTSIPQGCSKCYICSKKLERI